MAIQSDLNNIFAVIGCGRWSGSHGSANKIIVNDLKIPLTSSFSPQLCAYSLFHWSGLQKEGDELKKAIWGKEKWGCGRGEATYTEKKASKGWEIESAIKSKMRNWKIEITVWIQVKATLRALLDFC